MSTLWWLILYSLLVATVFVEGILIIAMSRTIENIYLRLSEVSRTVSQRPPRSLIYLPDHTFTGIHGQEFSLSDLWQQGGLVLFLHGRTEGSAMKRMGMRSLPWQLRTAVVLVLILAIGVLARELVPCMLQAQSVQFTDGLLLTTNRDHLALCVKPVAAATVDLEVAREQMVAALATLAQHPLWRPD